jgi:hypothetical protein
MPQTLASGGASCPAMGGAANRDAIAEDITSATIAKT